MHFGNALEDCATHLEPPFVLIWCFANMEVDCNSSQWSFFLHATGTHAGHGSRGLDIVVPVGLSSVQGKFHLGVCRCYEVIGIHD